MKLRSLALSVLFMFLLLWGVARGAAFQRYSNGFYTRSLDTAEYLDQGSGVFNPYYVPVKEWSLVPRVTLTVTRDDNLFLSTDNPEAATLIDLIPGAIFIYGRPDDNNLYLDAGTIIPVYDSTDNLSDSLNYIITFGGQYKSPKTLARANGGYRYKEDIDTVVGGRVAQEDYIFDVTVEQEISAKTSIGLDGLYEIHDYEATNLVDNTKAYGDVKVIYKNTESFETYLQLGAGLDDADAPGSVGDSDYYDLSIGFRGKQSPRLVLTGNAGYQFRNYLENDEGDFDHWIASLGFDATPSGMTTFYGEINTDLHPAVNSAGQTTVDQRLTLGVRRQLFTKRLQGAVSGFYGIVDYYGVSAADPAFNYDRQDEYIGYNLGVDYWANKTMSLGLDYSFFKNLGNRQGTQELKDQATYDQGRWVLRASWNF